MSGTFVLRKGHSTLSDLADGSAAVFATARNVFYVDKNNGDESDGNSGKNKDRPLLTIAQAYANCTDEAVDVIYVMGDARYREDELVIEKDGIRIIGSGIGCEWNRTSSQSGDYVVKVQASNVLISNIQISVNGSEDGIYIGDGGTDNDNASMCVIENCFIRGNWYSAAGSEGDVGITIDGSSFGPIVRNNFIWGWTTGIDVSDGSSRTAYGVHILDNYITGKTSGIVWAGYGYTSVIAGNTIWDWKSSVNMAPAIDLAHTVGGVLVADNYVGAGDTATDSGDLNYWVGNHFHEAEAASEALTVNTDAVT